jgi:hypothetical protein
MPPEGSDGRLIPPRLGRDMPLGRCMPPGRAIGRCGICGLAIGICGLACGIDGRA